MVGEQPESNYATINIITELCNHALKKTIKNTVQKDTQIHEAQIITEKLNIILDNIKISVPFIFQIIFYQQKESCHCWDGNQNCQYASNYIHNFYYHLIFQFTIYRLFKIEYAIKNKVVDFDNNSFTNYP